MNISVIVFVVCASILCWCHVIDGSFQDCFRRDSISCLQTELYRATRRYINNSTIEIVNGINLIKQNESQIKSLEQSEAEEDIEKAKDVQSRQRALETYLILAGENLWKERTVAWNPVQTARALVNSIPDTMTSRLTSFVSEGRGKKKKLQMLVPLLIALKLKFVTLASIAGMIIAVLAKKAILAAAISLVLSGVTGIKSLLAGTKSTTHATEVMGYQAPVEWEPTSFGNGGYQNYGKEDLLASSSNEPAPQHQVFIGHRTS